MPPGPSRALLVTDRADGALLDVRVIPRASRSAVAGVRDGALLVRLSAPPVDGAANEALVRLLAEAVLVARRRIVIIAGERSRRKQVLVAGLSAGDVARRLSAILCRE